ncbi:MAG: helix-turn-helix domain-containing protein [Actinomycetota bacterium]
MSLKNWEKKILKVPRAKSRIAEIEDELRLASGLTSLRERAGLSQRDLAQRMGVSQPRVAAIEQSPNVTIDVLEQYIAATDGRLEVTVISGNRRVALIGNDRAVTARKHQPKVVARKVAAKSASRRSVKR